MILAQVGNAVQGKMVKEKNIPVDNGFRDTIYRIERCAVSDQNKLTVYVDVLRSHEVIGVCSQYFIIKNKLFIHGISFAYCC